MKRPTLTFVQFICLGSLFSALFLSLVPVLQWRFSFVKEQTLEGFFVSAPYPTFSLSAWFSGEFQTSLETWWSENLGFRGAFIKTINQLHFSLFKEVGGRSKTKIELGKDNFLYEKVYIDNYHNRDSVSTEVLEKKVQDIKRLQDALEKKGIPFLLVISPSKATVYPEYLPIPWDMRRKGSSPTKYERIRPLLNDAKVYWIDSPSILLEKKSEYPFPLFTRGGTHWNYFAACLIFEKIITNLESATKKPMIHSTCDPAGGNLKPINTERDLAKLLNIWDTSFPNEPVPHPQLKALVPPHVYRPNVVWVGDSFVWTLVDIAYGGKGNQFESQNVYYYWQERHRFPLPQTELVDHKTLDWEKEIWNKDAIIVETNEIAVEMIGFGFIEAALEQLDQDGKNHGS